MNDFQIDVPMIDQPLHLFPEAEAVLRVVAYLIGMVGTVRVWIPLGEGVVVSWA